MKQFNYIIAILASAIIIAGTGCSELDNKYKAEAFYMFSDTVYTCPVIKGHDEYFEIVVGSTKAYDFDRTLGIEVVNSLSTARPVDYQLKDNNVTIKAGELTSSVFIKGTYYENTEHEQYKWDKHVTLRVTANDKTISDVYGAETKVKLRKACDWSIDDLLEEGGNFVINEYISYFGVSADPRETLVKAVKLDDQRVTFKRALLNGRDLTVRFDTESEDLFYPDVFVAPQLAVNLQELNGGWAYMRSSKSYPAYYVPCERLLYLNLELYRGDGKGSYGPKQVLLLWMTQEEADYYFPEGWEE